MIEKRGKGEAIGEKGSLNISGPVFTKGTEKNLCLKCVGSDPQNKKTNDSNVDFEIDGVMPKVDREPFTKNTMRVVKREIECGEQKPVPSAMKPMKNKKVVGQINKETWTTGTQKELKRGLSCGEQKPIAKKGADLYSETLDVHDHSDVEGDTNQEDF